MSTNIEPQNSQTPTPESTFSKGKKATARFFKKLFLILFLLLIVSGAAFYGFSTLTKSSGNRAGILIKFSQKGYVFKTYEGEMNLGGINPIPGNTIANNMWAFSVIDANVASKLDTLQGKKVRLHYKEKAKNFFWQGDTNYFVDNVEVIE